MELDDTAGGRDQHNNDRVLIKQVQEREQPAEAEDAMAAAKVGDVDGINSIKC